MYRLKEYPVHDNSNRGNDYKGHSNDYTSQGRYRKQLLQYIMYILHEIQILPLISIQGERLPISL